MNQTALLVIDVQKAFDEPRWGQRNNPFAESNIASLLAHWREQQRPVIHVRHCSTNPESSFHHLHPGFAYKPEGLPLPGEKQFDKFVNSGFIGTGLEAYLKQNAIASLVIVGLTTDHCVSTTTRMAGNLGFDAVLVGDATATFAKTGPDGVEYSADEIHRIHLASLYEEFCLVEQTGQILA
jgi:nicotinamidase-related amidase